ncbi:choice-of-anchor tandem repeat GloVer-containing protein [Ideonella sp.]|uniref:choice-of-anchor tandem repeat GloVer-containing protein n=1 Tax=Ideonella sp. TaxID=1929293 RepID=UPI0035B01826
MDDCDRVAVWRRGLLRGLAITATAVLGACGGSDEDPPATVRFVHHFSAVNGAAYYPASGLTQAPDGHFYGVSFAGGAADLGTLYRLTPDEKVEVRHAFQGDTSGALPNGDLVLADGGQALYGTTAMAGEGPSTAFRWSLSGQFSTFGYLGTRLSNTYDSGLVAGSDGNLHAATEYEWVSLTPGARRPPCPSTGDRSGGSATWSRAREART